MGKSTKCGKRLDKGRRGCYNPTKPMGFTWFIPIGKEAAGMKNLFLALLRSNFRCGRMLYSRAVSMAGRCRAPAVCRLPL